MSMTTTLHEIMRCADPDACLDIRQLAKGTLVLIETDDEIYELTVGTPKRKVVLLASDKRFQRRAKVVLVESVDADDKVVYYPHVISRGLSLLFRHQRGSLIVIGPVNRAAVRYNKITHQLWGDHA